MPTTILNPRSGKRALNLHLRAMSWISLSAVTVVLADVVDPLRHYRALMWWKAR